MLGRATGMTVAMALLLATGAEAKVPPKLLGKVFLTVERIRDQAPDALGRMFEKKTPKAELKRAKDGHWTATMVGFFRKPSVDGPITIWLYDRQDKAAIKAKEPVDAISVDGKPSQVFVYDIDINPDKGFNKGRTYLILVGQIIAKRERVYGQGEVVLQ